MDELQLTEEETNQILQQRERAAKMRSDWAGMKKCIADGGHFLKQVAEEVFSCTRCPYTRGD